MADAITTQPTSEYPNQSTSSFLNVSREEEVLQPNGEGLALDEEEIKKKEERCCGCCYVQPAPDEGCMSFCECLTWFCDTVLDCLQCSCLDCAQCIGDCCKECGSCDCDCGDCDCGDCDCGDCDCDCSD